MSRILIIAMVLGQSLWACSLLRLGGASPAEIQTERAPTEVPATSISPTSDSSPGCYYQWATRELSDLGRKLQQDLSAIEAGIQASAYAFGEDCRHDDGTATFLAMETDFRVRIPVEDLADEAVLGEWIRRVMLVVQALPPEEISGPRPGRVEFEFFVSDSENLRLNIEIAKYRAEAGDLEGAALFRHFLAPP